MICSPTAADRWLALMMLLAGTVSAADPQRPPIHEMARWRRPVAAVWLDERRTLCVANQRGGSLSLVDVPAGRVIDEIAVGDRLADVAALPDRSHVLTVDEQRHELVILVHEHDRLRVKSRQSVSPYPVGVVVSPDGMRSVVASLWSRRLQTWDITALSPQSEQTSLRREHDIRLPFAPRRMLWLPGSDDVVVADAFGGRLAVVNTISGEIVSLPEIDGHNLQGLALSADGRRLLITHQRLKESAPVTQDSIHWGEVMANLMCEIPLTDLRNPKFDLRPYTQLTFLGTREVGGGDPAGLVVWPSTDRIAVALSGVNQLGVVERGGMMAKRIPVGRRPLVVLPVGRSSSSDVSEVNPVQQVITLNSLDDSLSVVDLRAGKVVRDLSLGPQPEPSPADRGERLFFDARLSHDGWLSCHSCHVNGHTNGLRADTLGDGSYGAPKRTPTLLGTAVADKWGWNGSFQYLHEQIQKSLVSTLRSDHVTPSTALDLSAYLHTLAPPPPLEPATSDEIDRDQIARGRRVFTVHGCARCHVPPLTYTSHDTHDVGLADERGQTKFNAPSLRGVSQGRRFFHDNRAASVEDVFLEFNHPRGTVLSDDEIADLLRFLRSL